MTSKSKDAGKEQPDANLDELSIDKPRLTPRASVDPAPQGTDSTKPGGGVQQGQKDKAEGGASWRCADPHRRPKKIARRSSHS